LILVAQAFFDHSKKLDSDIALLLLAHLVFAMALSPKKLQNSWEKDLPENGVDACLMAMSTTSTPG
jgi:hypothetical protein